MRKISLIFAMLTLALCISPLSAEAATGDYIAKLDANGELSVPDGGINSGWNQQWYIYPPVGESPWWIQWWDMGDLDHDNFGVVSLKINQITRIDPSEIGTLEIAINYTDPLYDGIEPPTYENMANPEAHIIYEDVFNGWIFGSICCFQTEIVIDEWNPKWVSVDIRGTNIQFEQSIIEYECVPEPGTLAIFSLGAFLLRRKASVRG